MLNTLYSRKYILPDVSAHPICTGHGDWQRVLTSAHAAHSHMVIAGQRFSNLDSHFDIPTNRLQ